MKAIFVPIGIDVYTPASAASPAPDRTWFEDLPGVLSDTTEMTNLFEGDAFKFVGFTVKPRISGSYGEVYSGLQKTFAVPLPPACDALVVLWSGHGECTQDGELRLACREDQTPMQPGDGYPPAELARRLWGTKCPAVYLILDVCHAEAGTSKIYEEFAKLWNVSAARPHSLAILCAAGTASRARDSGIVPILTRLLKEGPSEAAKKIFAEKGGGYWSENDERLAPYQLSNAAAAEARAANLPEPYQFTANDVRLFPNPLFKAKRVARLAEQARLAFLSADAETHFLPKARGLDPAEPGWFFSGRVDLNRRLLDRLAEPGRLQVLTGRGGAGKSAILGRLTMLSDRSAAEKAGWREAVDPQGTVPVPGFVNAAVHLRGLTSSVAAQHLGEILLGDRSSGGSFDVDRLLKGIAAGEHKQPLIVLDALDESLEPGRISSDLILPLVRAGSRVLVGTRRTADKTNLLAPFEKLGGAYQLEDLTEQPDTGADIAAYVTGRLIETPRSPYFHRAPTEAAVQKIAAAVAARASGVFLYARITADSLVRRDAPLELTSGWEDRYLGVHLDGAFGKDLADFDRKFAERFGADEGFRGVTDGATALMCALAWGRGEGLPMWDDIWPRLASALAEPRPPYSRVHTQWLLYEAGRYIVEAGESEQAVYRLFHQSLNDLFHRKSEAAEVEGRIFSELREIARANRNPNPYIKRYLAPHANAAGRMPEILQDSWLVVLCEPFLRYCPPNAFPYLEGITQLYRAVGHRLGTEPALNASHLLLGARLYGNTNLENAIPGLGLLLPFTARWCDYLQPYPESIVFQDSYVASDHRVAWYPSGEMVAVADLRGIRFFHPEDGTPAGKRIELDLGKLVDIDWQIVDGRPLLAVVSSKFWLIDENQVAREIPLPCHWINGLAGGRIQDRDLFAIASDGGFWTYTPSENRFAHIKLPDSLEGLAICYAGHPPAFLVLAKNGVFSWNGASIDRIAWLKYDIGFRDQCAISGTFGSTGEIIVASARSYPGSRVWRVDRANGAFSALPDLKKLRSFTTFRGPSGDSFLATASAVSGICSVRNLRTGETTVLDAHEYPVDDFAIHETADETAVVTAGDRVRRWLFKNVTGPSEPLIYQGTHRVALGRAGASEICARFAETLEIIVPRAGQIIAENEVEWTAASLTSLTFGKMGQEIVLIAMTGRAYPSTCIIYRASDLKELTTFKGSDLELTRDLLKAGVLLETGARLGVSVFSVSAANPVLISPGDDELHIFDVESAKELCKLSGKQLSQNLRSAASTLLRGEQLIATAGIDGPIRLWKFASTSSTELIEARPPFLGHQAAVWRLSFGVVNGRPMLASGGMESPRIWDLATGQCLKIEIDHRVEDLVLSGSGLLAIGTKRGMITLQLSSAWVQNS